MVKNGCISIALLAAFVLLLLFRQSTCAAVGDLDPVFARTSISNGTEPGVVRSIVRDGTGRIIIAGTFTTVGNQPRGGIARLNSDGTLDPTFAPETTGANGTVYVALFSGSKIYIGGDFTAYDGTPCASLALLQADGKRDPSFTAVVNGPIYAAQLVSSNLYIAGDFTEVNGAARNRLAMLFGGVLDSFFSSGAGIDGPVYSLFVDTSASSPQIYVGGEFAHIHGFSRSHLGLISSFGFLDQTFSINVDGPVYAIIGIRIGLTRSVIVGGDFRTVGGQARGRLAKINLGSQPTVDPGMTVSANGPVRALAGPVIEQSTQVIVGGDFTTINGYPRGHFARLLTSDTVNTELDLAYHAGSGADGPVHAVCAFGYNRVLIGGEFFKVAGIDTSSVARLYGNLGTNPGSVPTNFAITSVSSSQIRATWSLPPDVTTVLLERSLDGQTGWTVMEAASPYYDHGLTPATLYYYRVRGVSENGAGDPSATLQATTGAAPWTGAGSLRAPFADSSGSRAVSDFAVQADGRVIVAESTVVNGSRVTTIHRYSAEGVVEPGYGGFSMSSTQLIGVVLQPSGKVVIAGSSLVIDGVPQPSLVRLNFDGSFDGSFHYASGALSSSVTALAAGLDGSLYVATGISSSSGGKYLARLTTDGSIDENYHAYQPKPIRQISLAPDGSLFLVDTSLDVHHVHADGSADVAFQTVGNAYCVRALPNGQAYVGGSFSQIGSVTAPSIARLNPDGTADTKFNAGAGPFPTVRGVTVQPDGKVILTGDFTQWNGTPRFSMVRLTSTGAVDPSFNVGAGDHPNLITLIRKAEIAPKATILVAGSFTEFGVSASAGVVALVNDGFPQLPSQPASLSIDVLSWHAVRVSWADVTNEEAWQLERSGDGGLTWTPILVLPWDVTSFTDTKLAVATSYSYRVRALNNLGTSPYSPMASAYTLNAYEQWKSDHGVAAAADTDDTDNDGVPLLLEYALGMNPNLANTDALPLSQSLNGALAISFSKIRPELSYTVEASSDLQNWSTEGVEQGSGTAPIAWTPLGGQQKYLRLHVSQ